MNSPKTKNELKRITDRVYYQKGRFTFIQFQVDHDALLDDFIAEIDIECLENKDILLEKSKIH